MGCVYTMFGKAVICHCAIHTLLILLQIARDMERWAKNVNAAKTAQKQQLQALIQLERAEVVARETEDQKMHQQLETPVSAVKRSGISLSAALEVVQLHVYTCTSYSVHKVHYFFPSY